MLRFPWTIHMIWTLLPNSTKLLTSRLCCRWTCFSHLISYRPSWPVWIQLHLLQSEQVSPSPDSCFNVEKCSVSVCLTSDTFRRSLWRLFASWTKSGTTSTDKQKIKSALNCAKQQIGESVHIDVDISFPVSVCVRVRVCVRVCDEGIGFGLLIRISFQPIIHLLLSSHNVLHYWGYCFSIYKGSNKLGAWWINTTF